MVVGAGRGRELPGIVDALVELAAEAKRSPVAEVRSAIELDRRPAASGSPRPSQAPPASEVEVKVVVDPTVLGGIVARSATPSSTAPSATA